MTTGRYVRNPKSAVRRMNPNRNDNLTASGVSFNFGWSDNTQSVTGAEIWMPALWRRWVTLVLQTSNEPAVVDMAEHILYVGRKPA